MYAFSLSSLINGISTTVQLVYADHLDADKSIADEGLSELIEGYNVRLPPSRLLFVCPSGVEDTLRAAFEDQRSDFEKRLTSASHVVISPYDEHGVLVHDKVVQLIEPESDWKIDDNLVMRFAQDAIAVIYLESKTVLQAPHGYSFRKLSSREESVFIRAGNMLRDPKCLSVFTYLMLRRLPQDCRVIFIDSFTILSFALGLQSIVEYFRRSGSELTALTIESFHSYDITLRIPNDDNYVIVISASTSGGLARKLAEEKQADLSRIFHILGVGDRSDEFADTCVYFREHDLSTTGNGDYGTRNGIIEIGTEEFLVAQGPPSPVSLTLDHINDQGSSELHKPFYRDALKFHESSVGGGYSVFSMRQSHSDSANSPIREWVFGRLVHQLPASMRLLVHVDDQMSHCLASWICEALAEDIAIVSMSDLDSISDESLAGGAIAVVAYDDPGLERLRRVNVLLRDLGAVHRHYVVGYSFPETDHEYRRVKNDLRVVSSKRKFGWSEYFVLPVGNATLHESLITGINALNDNVVETLRTELGDPLADRLLLKSRQCSNQMNELFLPNTSGLPLRLRPGSVLFPPKTSTDKITQTSVYAMVSAMVQAAREPSNRKLRNDESRLLKFDDNPFVRTVLDPSMFTRYNDGILQASLLRATQRSELDYSASDDLSRQFSTECESILLDHANGAGDAALEFIFALNTRKISLRPADDDKLNDRIKSTRVLDAFQRLLKRETGT